MARFGAMHRLEGFDLDTLMERASAFFSGTLGRTVV